MSICYTVADMLSLQVALVQYPEGWFGLATPGRMAPQRAAMQPYCGKCLTTNNVAYSRFKRSIGEKDLMHLFPTYDDLCGTRYDVASPKCTICGGPNAKPVDKR